MPEPEDKNLPITQTEKSPTLPEMALEAAKTLGLLPTRAVLNVLRAVFRGTLMMSDQMLERYLETGRKIAESQHVIESRKQILELQRKEAETYLELLKRDGDISVDRFQSLEEFSRLMNEKRVLTRALERLAGGSKDDLEGTETLDEEISDSWYDRFRQFARMKNDPWREEIMSACLARQAQQPGSVSLRALWNVAMLEEEEIRDLMDFVNLSAKLYRDGSPKGFYMVGYYAQLVKSDYVGKDGATKSVSDLFDRLEALDLFALGHGDVDLMKASKYELEMGQVRYAISMADNPPKDVADSFLEGQNAPPFGRDDENDIGGEGRYSLHAMPLTRAGNEIAALLDWQPSESAIKRFEEALRQQGENLKAVGLGNSHG